MKPDVTINEVSMLSLGWLRETVNFPTPQSQSNTITVPGRNSPIRFTEALGRVAYQPRSFDMTFSMLGDRADYDRLVSAAVNQFAGKLCRVTLTEDPTLYAIGTLEADPTYDPLTGKGQLVLSSTDGGAIPCPSQAREQRPSHIGKGGYKASSESLRSVVYSISTTRDLWETKKWFSKKLNSN